MGKNKYFTQVVLQIECPTCHRKEGRWCRDSKGKLVTGQHESRRKAALRAVCSFMPARKTA